MPESIECSHFHFFEDCFRHNTHHISVILMILWNSVFNKNCKKNVVSLCSVLCLPLNKAIVSKHSKYIIHITYNHIKIYTTDILYRSFLSYCYIVILAFRIPVEFGLNNPVLFISFFNRYYLISFSLYTCYEFAVVVKEKGMEVKHLLWEI